MTNTLVLAVGDAGCAISRQFNSDTAGVIVAINTSRDSLERSGFERQLLLGPEVCGGKGAVSLTQAEKAVVESKAALKALIQAAGRIVVVAGLGGSTGSAAVPVIADLALEHGAQVSVAVTLPFTFEQARRLLAVGILEQLRELPITIYVQDHSDGEGLGDGGTGLSLPAFFEEAAQHLATKVG